MVIKTLNNTCPICGGGVSIKFDDKVCPHCGMEIFRCKECGKLEEGYTDTNICSDCHR
jgi:predicted RNA-binding Zn-ribbon protein involved in translation (DUF1610 family)